MSSSSFLELLDLEEHEGRWSAILRSQLELCRLEGCGKPCYPGKNFCSKSHALEQMQLVAASCPKRSRPICRLPRCNRAAAVRAASYQEDVACRFYDFCTWTHAKEWHGSAPQEEEVASQLLLKCILSSKQTDTLNRMLDTIESSWPKDAGGKRMREEIFASGRRPVEFYKLHPWELLKEHKGPSPLYFISFRAQTVCKGKTERVTRDQLAWRQSSTPKLSNNGIVQKQSFSYKATLARTGHESDLAEIFRAGERLDQGTGKRRREVKWRYVMTEYSYRGLQPTQSFDSSDSESEEMLPVLHALKQRVPHGFPDFPPTTGAAASQTQEGQDSSVQDLDFSSLADYLDSPLADHLDEIMTSLPSTCS